MHVRSLVCPQSTLVGALSSYFRSGYSVSPRRIPSVGLRRVCCSQKAEKKNKSNFIFFHQWEVFSGAPYSLTPQQFGVLLHIQAQFIQSFSGFLKLLRKMQFLNIFFLREVIWKTNFTLTWYKRLKALNTSLKIGVPKQMESAALNAGFGQKCVANSYFP